MKYHKIVAASFLDRPNRFVAHVKLGGRDKEVIEETAEIGSAVESEQAVETVHVKNTGRCRELLLPGIPVFLEESENPNRKTKYDLVSVWKENLGWVNIDSQTPNKVALEWLNTQEYDYIKPEYTYGKSRIDFYMEKNCSDGSAEKYLLEVKGCTLEIDGTGYFPDAPTERGVKHIRELMKAKEEGYHAGIAFVIQMNGIKEVLPNCSTHPEFGIALEEAKMAGVDIIFLCCQITECEVTVKEVCYR